MQTLCVKRTELEVRDAVEREGFSIVPGVLSGTEIRRLVEALQEISDASSVRRRGGVFAVRNLLDVAPAVRELADSTSVRFLASAVLGKRIRPVRGILFDKIPDANWTVPWHQDLTIAVQARVEAEGYGPWSVKANVSHVQPPAEILENMLSIRIHLDDCNGDNGALRVIPGSHRWGRISEQDISGIRERCAEDVCVVAAGGALLMRPLLLHASSPSRTPSHRRVVHLDFASVDLAAGLRWYSDR
jgi:hypothetical protein